jgi:hypothetical protein
MAFDIRKKSVCIVLAGLYNGLDVYTYVVRT